MKKTHAGYIARSTRPQMDKLEDQVKAQQARLDAMIAKVKEMIRKS